MSLTGNLETNTIGGMPGGWGGWGGWGGGFGGFGLFGLIGLLGRRGLGGDGGDDCCDDIKNNARNLAVLQAIQNGTDQTVAEGRGIAAAICNSNNIVQQGFYNAAIANIANTQSIKDQSTALAIVADKRFDDLALAGVNQTAAILARINQTEVDNLRDQLLLERRRGDNREIEISIQNSNAQSQAQVQAQFQAQNDFLARKFFDFENQFNVTKQGIVNLGTMVASGTQATSATNIK